jgi:hypothetical protein
MFGVKLSLVMSKKKISLQQIRIFKSIEALRIVIH